MLRTYALTCHSPLITCRTLHIDKTLNYLHFGFFPHVFQFCHSPCSTGSILGILFLFSPFQCRLLPEEYFFILFYEVVILWYTVTQFFPKLRESKTGSCHLEVLDVLILTRSSLDISGPSTTRVTYIPAFSGRHICRSPITSLFSLVKWILITHLRNDIFPHDLINNFLHSKVIHV